MKKQISVKLTLNKATVSNLENVKGGIYMRTMSCLEACQSRPQSACCQTDGFERTCQVNCPIPIN